MKKILCLFLFALTLCFLCGCGNTGENNANDADTSEKNTLPEKETGERATEKKEKIPVAEKLFEIPDIGLRAFECVSGDEDIASAVIEKGSLKITAYGDGCADVDICDCFGHRARAEVEAKNSNIKVKFNRTEDKFLEVSTMFGAVADGKKDCAGAFARAMEKAQYGDTVFVYPGIYAVSFIEMKDGVTLRMYTTVKDAKFGYTDEIAKQAEQGMITVLKGTRIMNNKTGRRGADGSSDFTISGGMIDICGSTRGALIFCCADNALIENVIFKDIKNNHVIQLTGCTNSKISNCMFAGYTYGGTFTRETIQVEVSTPGATGRPPNSPQKFENGEFNYCENIEISDCYFGKSDKSGAPLIAIGHHSYAGKATVTGFRITDNVFDEVMNCAIRYCNINDTEIRGNKFISSEKYMNVNDPNASAPAFIFLYHTSNPSTYTNIVDGKKVTRTTAKEQSGIHGMKISGNTFEVGKNSDKKIILAYGPGNIPGCSYVRGIYRQDKFNSVPYMYSGYSVCSNYFENIEISDNKVNFSGQPKYKNYFIDLQNVYGLKVRNNELNLCGDTSFSFNSVYGKGIFVRNCHEGAYADRYHIDLEPHKKILFESDAGKFYAVSEKEGQINISVRGEGKLVFSADRSGGITVAPECKKGYVFRGFYGADGNIVNKDITVTDSGFAAVAVFEAEQ